LSAFVQTKKKKKGGFAAFEEEDATFSHFVKWTFSILKLHLLRFLPI